MPTPLLMQRRGRRPAQRATPGPAERPAGQERADHHRQQREVEGQPVGRLEAEQVLVAGLLHAGDAYFFHGQMQASPKMPLVLGMFQRRADMDRAMRIQNQERLRTLKANHGDAVTIFNSHDPVDYENCRCGQHQEVPAHAGAG